MIPKIISQWHWILGSDRYCVNLISFFSYTGRELGTADCFLFIKPLNDVKWLSWSISMYFSLALRFSRWSFQKRMKLRWHCCPARGQIRGRGINCHPEGDEELSQVSGYYAAMRGSWELLCSVLWMFRPLRSRSFMWDSERNGVNSYRMKEILSICTLVCVCVSVCVSFPGKIWICARKF